MQQGSSNASMDSEENQNFSSTRPSRSRNNSKLKGGLVRSHALREEPSPPRDPSGSIKHHTHLQEYSNHHHQQSFQSPCITLKTSPEVSPTPLVVLSPSMHSSTPHQCLSPITTLIPSPTNISRSSHNQSASSEIIFPIDRLQMDHQQDDTNSEWPISSQKFTNKTNSSKQATHSYKKKNVCNCQTQNCLKCMKNQPEKNVNNNLTNYVNITGSPNTLLASRANSRSKLRSQSSSLSSFDSCQKSPCLSRDSSSELYTDTTGVDLELFIPDTLNRNAKDRALMLRIEQELVSLAKDKTKTHYNFPPMSSYQRMLVHRCAAYFGMDHNIEPTGKCVVVNKTKNTRIPDVEFKEHVNEDIIFSEEPRRSILKRDSNSIDDYSFKSPDRSFESDSRRSKSFEEREEEYEKARRRIFNREFRDESSEDYGWSELPWSSREGNYSSRYLLQTPEMYHHRTGKLIKGHSEDPGEVIRPCVAKSYSFGGYGGNISVLNRGDSVMSMHSADSRLLIKQDSAASSVSWRLSPSSSGYKTQSQMSESVTPSPSSTPHPKEDTQYPNEDEEIENDGKCGNNQIVWAVTDIQNVPKGSLIINPQTGQPLKNKDGTLYRYDPNNSLPEIMHSPTKTQPPTSLLKSPQKETHQSAKRPHFNSLKNPPSRKSQITHNPTSPILPLSSPMIGTPVPQIPQKNYCFNQPDQPGQQYARCHATFTAPAAASEQHGTVYQQPCVAYSAPYSVHMSQQYASRLNLPANVGDTHYLPENSGAAPQIVYQLAHPSSCWNQPIAYYQNSNQPQNATATPPRYSSVPVQTSTQTVYLSTPYSQNLITTSIQPNQNPPDMQSVYPNQSLFVYPNQPPPPATYYPNHPPLIYSQNPVYSSQQYSLQMGTQVTSQPAQAHGMQNYPHGGTTTPNNYSLSTTPAGHESQMMFNLAQSIHQMNLGGVVPCQIFINNRGNKS